MSSQALSQCFAIGCNAMKPGWALMCARHWRMVPSRIQADVYAAHAAWKKDNGLLVPYLIVRGQSQAAVARAEGKSENVISAIDAEIAGYEARDRR